MPIPLEQRGQPIVRPCSLTRASVTYQRFCVAAGSGAMSPGASSTLTFGLARVPHCRSTGNSPGPTAIEVFGLGLNGSPESLSTYSRLHLADSGCRLMVRNVAHPMLVAAQVLFRVFCLSQPDQLQAVHFVLATQQPSSKYPSPDDFAETGKSASVADVPKHFTRGSPVSSYMIPAKDPATMSYRPTGQVMIRLQPASYPRFCRVLHCAQDLPHGDVGPFHGAHGRVTLKGRTHNQCSLLPSRLDFAEDECQRYLLIRSQQNLDV